MTTNASKSMPHLPNTSTSTTLLDRVQKVAEASQKARRSEWTEETGSENSQVLFMKPGKESKRNRRSLSTVSNNVPCDIAKGAEKNGAGFEYDESEDFVWKVIDREIFEWQYVCRTGRPYWWSPESKYCRLKKLQPNLFRAPGPHIWLEEMDDGANRDYEPIRRAVSDNIIADPGRVDELAQLIAVQLLGACFTIPPDLAGIPSPNYKVPDRPEFPDLFDSRMISSLRMHTHFRYSPAFGHQARNTSPVESWLNTYAGYDGTSTNTTPAESSLETPDIVTSQLRRQRRGTCRALHITEGSLTSCSDGSYDSASMDSATVSDEYCPEGSKPETESGRDIRTQQLSDPREYARENREEHEHLQASQQSKSDHRLQSILRSESHPVYVQPVKDLVVRKWKRIRRRVGGKMAVSAADDDHSLAVLAAATAFMTPSSGDTSPASSSDGKERRRLAQERGEILSSSTEGTPLYNTPTSIKTPTNGETTSVLQHSHAMPAAETGSYFMEDFSREIPALPVGLEGRPVQDMALFSPTSFEHSMSVASAPAEDTKATMVLGSYMPQRAMTAGATSVNILHRRTKKRRSLLSEVYNADETEVLAASYQVADIVPETEPRSILSAIGSAIPSPEEEAPAPLVTLQPPSDETGVVSQSTKDGSSCEADQVLPDTKMLGLVRSNTSGTQLFKPFSESMEVEGMLIDPAEDTWNGDAGSGVRRERNFL
ncbi:hypothetical protein BP6252_09521 [Coleophoma cylindrospora]|uniref:Uncharacterized protein n=1 Tax=Coleophoma cylindrospora TaxID=1849047 RepID=A0A3D8R249_9HELO|nr:hypothetical protein BP6252_09521 [Coleophoma cylindrospora]